MADFPFVIAQYIKTSAVSNESLCQAQDDVILSSSPLPHSTKTSLEVYT